MTYNPFMDFGLEDATDGLSDSEVPTVDQTVELPKEELDTTPLATEEVSIEKEVDSILDKKEESIEVHETQFGDNPFNKGMEELQENEDIDLDDMELSQEDDLGLEEISELKRELNQITYNADLVIRLQDRKAICREWALEAIERIEGIELYQPNAYTTGFTQVGYTHTLEEATRTFSQRIKDWLMRLWESIKRFINRIFKSKKDKAVKKTLRDRNTIVKNTKEAINKIETVIQDNNPSGGPAKGDVLVELTNKNPRFKSLVDQLLDNSNPFFSDLKNDLQFARFFNSWIAELALLPDQIEKQVSAIISLLHALRNGKNDYNDEFLATIREPITFTKDNLSSEEMIRRIHELKASMKIEEPDDVDLFLDKVKNYFSNITSPEYIKVVNGFTKVSENLKKLSAIESGIARAQQLTHSLEGQIDPELSREIPRVINRLLSDISLLSLAANANADYILVLAQFLMKLKKVDQQLDDYITKNNIQVAN